MAGRYGDLDYATLTKRSFLFGVALFVVGALGEFALAAGGVTVSSTVETVLFDAEMVGIVVALLSPFVFGIFLPLTE